MLHNLEAKSGEACFVNFLLRFVRSRDGGVTRLAGIGFVIHQIGFILCLKTCFCFLAVIFLGFIVLTSQWLALYYLFYVTREFHRFLHRVWVYRQSSTRYVSCRRTSFDRNDGLENVDRKYGRTCPCGRTQFCSLPFFTHFHWPSLRACLLRGGGP